MAYGIQSQLQRRGLTPGSLIRTGLYNPQPGDPRFAAHQTRMKGLTERMAQEGSQGASGISGIPTMQTQGPASLGLGRQPGFLSQQMQQQRGARASVGVRQGPPASQRKMLFPGQDPRRNVFGARQFGGARTSGSVARDVLRRGSFGMGGGFQRNPISFGILGRGAGRLGQRTR